MKVNVVIAALTVQPANNRQHGTPSVALFLNANLDLVANGLHKNGPFILEEPIIFLIGTDA